MRQPYRRIGKSEYRSTVRISKHVVNPPVARHHDYRFAPSHVLDPKPQRVPKRHHGRIGVLQTPKQVEKCPLWWNASHFSVIYGQCIYTVQYNNEVSLI